MLTREKIAVALATVSGWLFTVSIFVFFWWFILPAMVEDKLRGR